MKRAFAIIIVIMLVLGLVGALFPLFVSGTF